MGFDLIHVMLIPHLWQREKKIGRGEEGRGSGGGEQGRDSVEERKTAR